MNENYIPYLLVALQKNLNQLLKVSNMTIEEFSKKLNVNDQTIRNLISYDTLLTVVQLIAILTIIEQEKINSPENKFLSIFYAAILDPKNYKEYLEVTRDEKPTNITKNMTVGVAAAVGSLGIGMGAIAGSAVGAFISFLPPGLALGVIGGSAAAISIANKQSSLKKQEIKAPDWKEYLYKACPISENEIYTEFKKQFLEINKNKLETKKMKESKLLKIDKLLDDYINIFLKKL